MRYCLNRLTIPTRYCLSRVLEPSRYCLDRFGVTKVITLVTVQLYSCTLSQGPTLQVTLMVIIVRVNSNYIQEIVSK